MEKKYITAMVSVSLLIWSNGLQAQDTGTKLNQVELIKQFVSSWKGEIGKDTTAYWEVKYNGTGIDCSFKYVAKDKVIMEGKQLWEYDKKIDKFILTSVSGMQSGKSSLWFTSKNKCLIVSINDISNPEKATFKIDTEFKSPDVFIQKTIVNNNLIKTETYNRVKN